MWKYVFASFVLLSTTSLNAQWRKIADFRDSTDNVSEIISGVYFLDLPGPPRIGFAGAGSLYKTNDGGKSWHSVLGVGFSDICFKDSMTGWIAVLGNPSCYRTTDGGNSWTPLNQPFNSEGGWFISYDSLSNLLFLTTADKYHGLVSKDMGATWEQYPFTSGQFVFYTPLIGTLGVGWSDTLGAILKTSDGGKSWDTLILLHAGDTSWKGGGSIDLPIEGTSICYEADYGRIYVRRSDDYGKTWKILKDFGPVADTNGNPIPNPAPRGTGVIHGDFSRLYIQTDSGMYVSTDSGYTWNNDGGPPGEASGNYGQTNFYALKGVAFVGGTTVFPTPYAAGTGLWEEIWPQSAVTQPNPEALANISVFPNPTTGLLTITGASGLVEVENVLGEVVLSATSHATTPQPPPLSEEGELTLDLSRLPAGTYFVRVETSRGMATQRVVKSQ